MRSKLRALLTILGILIGVAAVVIVTALGTGVQDKVVKSIQSLGSNTILIISRPAQRSGARGKAGVGGRMTEADGQAILREATSVAAVVPMVSAPAQVVFGDRNTSTAVIGTTRDYLKVRSYELERGEMWTETDERLKTKVCVMGATTAANLFGSVDPVGQIVRIGKYPFRVVGTLERKGQSLGGEDPDDRLLMPVGSFRARVLHLPAGRVWLLMASATDVDTTARAEAQIRAILLQRHNITDEDDPDFVIHTQAEFMQLQEQIFGTLQLLLVGIAVVSLVVGGIGVMNIMLVSVTERTREIGIRMAIGAREGDIMIQFLIEALVLCSLGGLSGTVVGLAAIQAMVVSLGWNMILPPQALIAALATSATIGVVFGFFPARRAARLDPIEALHHE
ncbi:MAG: ABC transporter permease [Deltaproteobacteria bacterium]|nr:ABC transporter permease [Deltaproteobacteria bacterium]